MGYTSSKWSAALGRNLYRLRMERHMTQKEAARLLHIAPRTLQKLERGEIGKRTRTSLLFDASRLFGVEVASLFDGE